MERDFDSADEGKQVVTPDGAVVGWVERIDDGHAYVRPKPGLIQACGSWVGEGWKERELFSLDHSRVVHVSESDVYLAEQPADGSETSESFPHPG